MISKSKVAAAAVNLTALACISTSIYFSPVSTLRFKGTNNSHYFAATASTVLAQTYRNDQQNQAEKQKASIIDSPAGIQFLFWFALVIATWAGIPMLLMYLANRGQNKK